MESAHYATPIDILAFAEIKAAVKDFDSGETNLIDALHRIKDAVALSTVADCSQKEAA